MVFVQEKHWLEKEDGGIEDRRGGFEFTFSHKNTNSWLIVEHPLTNKDWNLQKQSHSTPKHKEKAKKYGRRGFHNITKSYTCQAGNPQTEKQTNK